MRNRAIGCLPVHTRRANNRTGRVRFFAPISNQLWKLHRISGKVGWHTLRHTFGTLMKANGEDIKTIQELLRHSNYKVTADTYTQAVTSTKRAAQTKIGEE